MITGVHGLHSWLRRVKWMQFLVIGAYELRSFCTRISVLGSEIQATVLRSRRIVTVWTQQCEIASPVISVFRVPEVMFLTIVCFRLSISQATKKRKGWRVFLRRYSKIFIWLKLIWKIPGNKTPSARDAVKLWRGSGRKVSNPTFSEFRIC
jgi:hypothetical protein